MRLHQRWLIIVALGMGHVPSSLRADETLPPADAQGEPPSMDVLTPPQWTQVDLAIQRGLRWLIGQQQGDGAFPTSRLGQPGITSLGVLALLSRGHLPGEGPYGEPLQRAVGYVLSSQRRNGLLARVAHDHALDRRRSIDHKTGVAAAYNHAISALVLSEVYAMSGSTTSDQIEPVIERALEATLAMQAWPKSSAVDQGGWRYLHPFRNVDADLSIVGWQVQFLRSAKNAGYRVPQDRIDAAVAYVLKNFSNRYGVFEYTTNRQQFSRGMAGAGILALAHAGMHHRPEAVASAEWILRYPFSDYNRCLSFGSRSQKDRYHYGVFHCAQAMYQMGGKYWQQFYPRTAATLLANQNSDGSWDAESHPHETEYGQAYTTSLAVLALGAPNQLLPIYQR